MFGASLDAVCMGLFANRVASLDGAAVVAGVHPQLCQHSVGYEAVVEHPVVHQRGYPHRVLHVAFPPFQTSTGASDPICLIR